LLNLLFFSQAEYNKQKRPSHTSVPLGAIGENAQNESKHHRRRLITKISFIGEGHSEIKCCTVGDNQKFCAAT
jgi:hypothetical protein